MGAERSGWHAALAQIAREGIRMSVCQQDAPRCCGLAGLQQRRPIRMVRDDESTVIPAPPAVTAHAHPAGAESAGVLPETSHPGCAGCTGRSQDQGAAEIGLAVAWDGK